VPTAPKESGGTDFPPVETGLAPSRTGCAGSPACVEYCPVEDCMFWIPDDDHPPYGRIEVDPLQCIGCKKCLSKGPEGAFLDGCPWDAIVMVDIAVVEKEVGPMSY